MNFQKNKKSVAVVGGGITGINVALELAKNSQYEVFLLEKSDQLGGLSSIFTWQNVTWDRYYHVVLSTDAVMLDFLKQIGLEGELFWKNSSSGFFKDGCLVSMSSAMDFFRFPFLTLWQKFRLGIGILYSFQIRNPDKLDRIYVREWLTKVFGRRVYENIWDPLLRSKLGNASERTSAAFIWATINRLYGARSAKNKREKMGHVHGGYRTILAAAERALKNAGVKIMTSSSVETVLYSPDSTYGLEKRNFLIKSNNKSYLFDKVILSVDCPTILKIVKNISPHPYWQELAKVEYLGLICLLLILKRKLSPYYVINLLDRQLPFTGVIEATNIVSSAETGGKHIVYLPKYLPGSDSLNSLSDGEIKNIFLQGLKKVFPDLMDNDILFYKVFRENFVQPLQELNFLNRATGIKTPIQNLYIVNTSMIYNSTLNNNAAISLAREAVKFAIE